MVRADVALIQLNVNQLMILIICSLPEAKVPDMTMDF